MNRLIQRVGVKAKIPYDGAGFDALQGENAEEQEEVRFHFDFLVTNQANVYRPSEVSMNTFVDDPLIYEVEAVVFEDHIFVSIPYVYTVSWFETVTHHILLYLEDAYSLQIHDENTGFNYQFTWNYNSPNPLLTSYDILRLFEGSLYEFEHTRFTAEELELMGATASEEPLRGYSLVGPDHIAGIYFVPEYDSFYLTTEYSDEPLEMFDKMVYKLMSHQAPIDQIENPYEDVIDTQSLIPWLYHYEQAGVAFWKAIKNDLYLTAGDVMYRDECYNQTKEYADWVTTLQARRMEVDLLATLDYERPLTEYNFKTVLGQVDEIVPDTPSDLLWWSGTENKQEEDKHLHRGTPHTTFAYPIEIGSQGDIVYFESDDLPLKVAVKLDTYQPVIPLADDIDFELGQQLSPFAWFGKPLGATKLTDELSNEEIKSHLRNEQCILYQKHFEEGTQLIDRELDETLDVRVNLNDGNTWESST